jgi:oxygen-independent coproporphyrinogen III oxidase
MSKLMRPSFDLDLIEKHGGEGPRYTSYPTAPQFTERFNATDYCVAISDSNKPADSGRPVAVCACAVLRQPCFYCGCNRVITRSLTAGDQFLANLERELALVAPRFDEDRLVRQLHLGGGTPTFLSVAQLGRLMHLLQSHFAFDPEAEMGLEIDPRTIDPEGIGELGAWASIACRSVSRTSSPMSSRRSIASTTPPWSVRPSAGPRRSASSQSVST